MNTYTDRAELMKLLAHPMRLQILDILRCESECVCHLSAVLHKPQPYVSQQLAVLRNAGLIDDVREGSNVFYRLADAELPLLLAALLDPSPQSGTDSAKQAVNGCVCPKCQGQ
jgi:ArsR family transcriptional regulator